MDLNKMLAQCQSLLRAGYDSIETSGLEWLKKLCREFELFCRELHQYLADMPQSSTGSSERLLDDCLLCSTQIVDCLAWLEQAIRVEIAQQCVLSICRQHFLDRITWCISRMESSITSHHKQNSSHERHTQFDANFVTSMDYALELIEPLTMFVGVFENAVPQSTKRLALPTVKVCYAVDGKPNTAASRAESMLTSQHIRSAINSLIGHALTFANVALAADHQPITTVCQTVLRLCISFEQSTGLATHDAPNTASTQMSATALESSLYQLDGLLNDCLLRLVYVVFGQLDPMQRPMERLRGLIASSASQVSVDAQIEEFDLMTDRLHQIGIFAAAFAGTQADRTRIRSAIASAESLEAVLVPALLSSVAAPEPNCALLVRHWKREMGRLRRTVLSIIDTDAFCGSLYDQLTPLIAEQQRTGGQAAGVRMCLDNCAVLLQHLHINRDDLKLDGQPSAPGWKAGDRVQRYADLRLMLDECRAALDVCVPAEWQRIVKRLKILHRVLKKFRATLDKGDDTDENGPTDLVFGSLSTKPSEPQARNHSIKNCVSVSSESLFQDAGISRNISGILYRSNCLQRRRTVAAPQDAPATMANRSTDESERIVADLLSYHSGQTAKEKVSNRKRVIKKSSLRTALFKRIPVVNATAQNDSSKHSRESSSVDPNQTLDLHITDILEQITDLSVTLSNRL